ncbi:HMA2 domain-containing protein [Kluyvera sp. CHPC 1.2972]|uniref:HMA2 domain-containing protein n=1 Tax=Kluyvera sp. CHPC 1.2972 TaxID=2995176 RepID=UPI002FD81F0D
MPVESLGDLLTLRRFVEVAHHIPGRLRLRFSSKLVASLSQGKLRQLDAYCSPEGYLRRYQINSETGSIVLEYDAAAIRPQILNQLFGQDGEQAQHALAQLAAILSPSH